MGILREIKVPRGNPTTTHGNPGRPNSQKFKATVLTTAPACKQNSGPIIQRDRCLFVKLLYVNFMLVKINLKYTWTVLSTC